jgi:nucleotide-binding universal stress UspA family protein
VRSCGQIAKATGSELHLLNVALISRYIYPDILSDTQVARIREEAQARLAAEAAQAAKAGTEITDKHLRLGRIDVEILTLAESLDVGLIVIGSRSGDAVRRILLGNDAESIVRHAHCAVLVVRDQD